MKTFSVCAFMLLSAYGFSQAPLKNVGNAAKNKLESQDFNSSRSNKERANLSNEKKSSPAPAAAPPVTVPDTTKPASKPADGGTSTTTSGKRTYNNIYVFDKIMTYETSDPGKPDKAPEPVTYSYSDGAIMTQFSQNPDMQF